MLRSVGRGQDRCAIGVGVVNQTSTNPIHDQWWAPTPVLVGPYKKRIVLRTICRKPLGRGGERILEGITEDEPGDWVEDVMGKLVHGIVFATMYGASCLFVTHV